MKKLPNGSRNERPENIGRIRSLRREASISEKVFWQALRKEKTGFKFRRQHPVGPYALDFYCPEAKLCIEVDGPQHEDRQKADERRDAYLADFGIDVVRIPSIELFDETGKLMADWIRKIVARCEARSGRLAWPEPPPPPPTPSPSTPLRSAQGEGA